MSSETQDVLDKIFAALSGGGMGGSGGGLAGALTAGLVGGGSNAAASPKQSGGSTAASIGMDILKSGLGLVPLVSGLLGLFGGGGSDAPPPLVKYALPPSIQFQGAETRGGPSGETGIVQADYDQGGMARSYPQAVGSGDGMPPSYPQAGNGDGMALPYPQAAVSGDGMAFPYPQAAVSGDRMPPSYPQTAGSGDGTPPSYPQAAGGSGSGWNGQPYINVTVQAMDARSFLDRSGDIAAAVRDAMLNLNSINDVVNDL
jgi:hypothetical protein